MTLFLTHRTCYTEYEEKQHILHTLFAIALFYSIPNLHHGKNKQKKIISITKQSSARWSGSDFHIIRNLN